LALADTIVLTHAQPSTSQTGYSVLPGITQELLEKPTSKEDNLRMLLDMNGGVCEVVTGVTIGANNLFLCANFSDFFRAAFPILQAPGYGLK